MTSSSSCCSSSAALSLVAIFLFVAASTPPLPVHGQPINIPPVITSLPVIITGQLCCTPTGNCPGQALPGVPVALTCLVNNVTTPVANTDGAFTLINITSNLPTNVFPTCVVTVSRSMFAVSGMCSLRGDATGEVLISIVRFIEPIVGRVFNATVSSFINI